MGASRLDMNTFRGTSSHTVQFSYGISREGRVEQRLSDTLLLKTHADEYRWAEPDAYSEFVPLLEVWSVLTALQFRTWARNWRLELCGRKLTAVLRATFS